VSCQCCRGLCELSEARDVTWCWTTCEFAHPLISRHPPTHQQTTFLSLQLPLTATNLATKQATKLHIHRKHCTYFNPFIRALALESFGGLADAHEGFPRLDTLCYTLRSFLIYGTTLTNPQKHATSAKMVQDRGLDVYLAPFDNIEGRYLEHAVPTRSSAFTGNPNEVYIEAVNSERFAVVIDLLQDFDVKGGTHLRIIYAIEQSRDNNSRGCYIDLPSLQARAPPGPTVKGRKALIAMDMKVHGAYPSCGFVFSPLKTGIISILD
jgi:hypothetical protein